MPHEDQTPQQALDALSASARELSAAYANLSTHVQGAEARRVCRVLEFEVDEMNGAISILRKAFGDQRDAARVQARVDRGESPRPTVPVPVGGNPEQTMRGPGS